MEQGLDSKSATRLLQIKGANVVREIKTRTRTEIFKDQFVFLPTALLLGESLIALLRGGWIEAIILAAITFLNAMVGYGIDRRAEQMIASLKRRPKPTAQVIRDGAWVELTGENLVIGDVLKLVPGVYVGADCRIVKAVHLKIDESILTGESNPVDKHAQVVGSQAPQIFDRYNMAFMGTLVVGGDGLAVVVATGSMTEYGRLNDLFAETIPPQTSVMKKIHALSSTLLKFSLRLSVGTLLLGILGGQRLLTAMGHAFSVAAAGIPAGLPSAATVNMAVGFQRLQRRNVSIRRLYSLESLSAVELICFDKTGTLTRSRINVQQIYCAKQEIRVDNQAFWISDQPFALREHPDCHRLLTACVLCSESRLQSNHTIKGREIGGSPTEKALLQLARKAGLDLTACYRKYPLQKVQHRSAYQRYMMTVHALPGGRSLMFVKGDPLEVLNMCNRELLNKRRIGLTPGRISAIEIHNQRMADKGLRVLGFAYGTFNAHAHPHSPSDELTWIGLIGMAEPIRDGVPPMIAQLHQAGIRTVMITGDQSKTAEAVARKIGLSPNDIYRIFDSSRFDTLPPALAAALIRDVHVFARVNPAQKLQIIQAYQRRNMVVAMTGDGINDGPALRAADIGIAMGVSGTDAARDVADMVLERDNIASVHTTILEGRSAYRNLKRSLRYFITTRFSELLLTVAASAITPAAPLTESSPVKINLFTELAPGLALLMEPVNPQIGLEHPRKPTEPVFSHRDMRTLLFESGAMSGGAFAAFCYGLMRYGPGTAAATLASESLTTAKILHALTCRPWTADAARRPANPWLKAALAAAFLTQAGTILLPGVRRFLNMAPLNPTDLMIIGLTALSSRLINHNIHKKRSMEANNALRMPARNK